MKPLRTTLAAHSLGLVIALGIVCALAGTFVGAFVLGESQCKPVVGKEMPND